MIFLRDVLYKSTFYLLIYILVGWRGTVVICNIIGISAGTLCPGRRRPRPSTATACIYSMYSLFSYRGWGRSAEAKTSL